MKPTFLLKATSTIGLIALLYTTLSTGIQRTAQAQIVESAQVGISCPDAYFEDPDYMYSFQPSDLSEAQRKAIQQASNVAGENTTAISAEVTTFSVELDAPFGYVVNEENGEAVEVPPEIRAAMDEALNFEDIAGRREQVKVLNEKYGQYATFGQQITLIFSPEQAKRVDDGLREFNAKVRTILTDEQKQAFQDLEGSEGTCQLTYGFEDIGTIVVEIGKRPDLDQRLSEDTSNTTFFD